MLLIPFFFFITKTVSYPHYFVIILPLCFLILGIGLDLIFKKIKFLAIFFLIIFLTSNFIFESYFYKYLDTKKIINGDYGPIYSVSDSKINYELSQYQLSPYFYELKSFAFIYSGTEVFHENLGNFFLQKNNPELAQGEFEKQLRVKQTAFSLANLADIYIFEKDYSDASKIIGKLEKTDKKTAEKLKQLMKN